ncbi:MAG: EAL domain-containing protein [Solirubrobacteraceae bacterium]
MSCCTKAQDAIAGRRLAVFAQPICDLDGGATVFEELLLRVRTSSAGIVGPGELLASAEREGTISQIDEWVLQKAAELTGRGRAVSVNVSAASVSDPAFLEAAERILHTGETDPALITFEVTETALASDLIQACRFAERLVGLGCSFALDDFGTGYGSLTYLKHLPIRYLKIDMSFIRDLVHDRRSQALVGGIVALARGFEHHTVAEGIEDAATLTVAADLGVDLGQGFLIGHPREIVA